MTVFITRRLFETLITALIVAVIVFLLARLAGDPVPLMMPGDSSQDDIDFFRRQLGLDRPVYEQFFVFLGNVLRGDFGNSFRYDRPAMDLVLSRLPATGLLAGASMFFAIVIGLPLGVAAAIHRGSWLDHTIRWFATIGQATPNFWFALMLVLLLSVWWRLLPTSGYGTAAQLIMPTVTLGLGVMSYITRLTRSSMIEVLQADFVKLERLSGVPDRLIVYKHALRNSAIPVVTFVGLQLGALLGGAVATETIFNWPGIGQLTVNAIMFRDFPVIQASVLLIAVLFLILNFLVDVSYRLLDPRVRL